MKLIDGKQYYSIEEMAALAGLSVRTLRRYLSDNRLSDFVYPFKTGPNEVSYRLEEPDASEMMNEKGEWLLSSDIKQTARDGTLSEGGCCG